MPAIDITGAKPRITFYLEEGNFTRDDDMITDQGPAKGGSFASKLSVEDEVQIYTGADMTVQVLSTGKAVGRIANRPEWKNLPKENKTSGNYERRIASVEVDGTLDRVRVIDTNQAITAGDYMAVSSSDKGAYDKEEDTTTNVIALQAKSQNAGGYIRVLRIGKSQVVAD